MLHPTMLQRVVLACCDRLAGALLDAEFVWDYKWDIMNAVVVGLSAYESIR